MSSSSTKSGDEEQTIANDLVVTKYNMAGEIVNKTLKLVIEKCVEGAKIHEICLFGDKLIEDETSKVFKKNKEIKKGIAFPTCISVNNCVCHFSPLVSDHEILLKSGDLVKIDLGAHVDGYIGVIAHTIVVNHISNNKKVDGRIADVILAAHYCAEACHRLIKNGNNNSQVTEAMQKICESFKCKPIEGILMHQLKQHQIEGDKSIIQNPSDTQKQEHEKSEFKTYEVYGVDCLISTGDGKGKEMDARTTVYKKTDEIYNLKLKASRALYSEVDKKFGLMPFTLRGCEDEKKARMGLLECVNHKLMIPFPVLWEKEGEYVAHFKYTLLIMPNNNVRITSGPFILDNFESKFKIEDDSINALLKSSTKRVIKKKKKKIDIVELMKAAPLTINGEA
ncbi:unnamed protein product, partial [Gordionus sp. m RMFG-2023]